MKTGMIGSGVGVLVAALVLGSWGAFVLGRDGVIPRSWAIVAAGPGGQMVVVGKVFEDYDGWTYASVEPEGGGPFLKLLQAGPCDVDRDGFVTGADFDAFSAWYVAGDRRADFDRDGFVTGADFDAFMGWFVAGDPRADFDRSGWVNGLDAEAFTESFVLGTGN